MVVTGGREAGHDCLAGAITRAGLLGRNTNQLAVVFYLVIYQWLVRLKGNLGLRQSAGFISTQHIEHSHGLNRTELLGQYLGGCKAQGSIRQEERASKQQALRNNRHRPTSDGFKDANYVHTM